VTQRYALGVADAMRLAMKRQWIFFLRNKAFIVFRLLQVSLEPIRLATLGLKTGLPFAAASLSQAHSCWHTQLLAPACSVRGWSVSCSHVALRCLLPLRVQMIVMGLIVGSLFFNVPPDRSGVRTLLGGERGCVCACCAAALDTCNVQHCLLAAQH
jgi:hypothetical protein